LVLATMKNAAKCDTQCELQNSVNHQTFERILRSGVFIRACLFQWRLPLSPAGHLGGLARSVRAARAAGFERVTAPRGCVAPGAEATDSISWVYSKHLHQRSSVVVGFALPIADSEVGWHFVA